MAPVPTEILATSLVEQPVLIPAPRNATISITATSNAAYYQKVTVLDILTGRQYVFSGTGEGIGMQVAGEDSTPLVLAAAGTGYRALSVLVEHSVSGKEGSFSPSSVPCPRTEATYEQGGDYDTPQEISWEIVSEDSIDSDYNDSVIKIVARLERQAS